MIPKEIADRWDVVLNKDKWEIYKYYTKPILEKEEIANIILGHTEPSKSLDELLEEGKSFKEINEIMKGR